MPAIPGSLLLSPAHDFGVVLQTSDLVDYSDVDCECRSSTSGIQQMSGHESKWRIG